MVHRSSETKTALIGFDAQLDETDAECTDRDGRLFDFDVAQETADHSIGT
ncbi:MAG: hypothetical protein OXC95_11765 [Dehalococcoidia bacterium]|nr:hypothetical protein [Dehalococcoidia bacterium]